MKIGYVRCSTLEQNAARQLKMMEEHSVKKFFVDKQSGKDMSRPEFNAKIIAKEAEMWL